MNGNFEVGKDRYPFNAVHIGARFKVLFMPTQVDVLEVPVPASLGAAVALRLNTLYYAEKAGGQKFSSAVQDVKRIALEELLAAYDRREITGVHYDRLKIELTE